MKTICSMTGLSGCFAIDPPCGWRGQITDVVANYYFRNLPLLTTIGVSITRITCMNIKVLLFPSVSLALVDAIDLSHFHVDGGVILSPSSYMQNKSPT